MLRFIHKNKKIHRGELRNHWNYREGRKKCFFAVDLLHILVLMTCFSSYIMSDFCCGGHIIFGFTEFWWFFVGFPSVVNVRLLIWRWHCRFPFWRGLLLAWIEMHLTIKSMLIFLICLSDAILVQQNAIW
jgi:hypothetical protein